MLPHFCHLILSFAFDIFASSLSGKVRKLSTAKCQLRSNMRRRGVLKGAALLAALGPAAGFAQAFGNQESSSPIPPRDRLEQGPFDIDQDEGWLTALFTTPSEKPLRNPGLGLVGYSWEESGPSLAARAGRETLEQHVENISSLPFVDVLYIRCDWRNVQSRPGRLDLDPVWKLTLDAAKSRGLRVRSEEHTSELQSRRDLVCRLLLEKKKY